MKLLATINPNNAGYQSPIFLMAGENTEGKLNTIQVKPRIQMIRIRTGRLMDDCILLDVPIYRFSDVPIFWFLLY